MKIACESCGARYSVADDKVRGRTFKIRCRRCEAVIVSRGSAAPRWYLALDGVEAGPLTTSELSHTILEGDVGPATPAWRDGLSDWTSLSQLAEFTHLLAPLRTEGTRDLFGPPPEAPELATQPDAAPPEAPGQPAAPLLVASRNESSVLFSIGNLQALAAGAPTASTAPAPAGGSGLIDIRTMARGIEPDSPADALVGLSPMGSPAAMLLPALPTSSTPRWLFPALGAMGSALVAAVVLLVVVLTPKPVVLKDEPPSTAPKPESSSFIDTDEVMVEVQQPEGGSVKGAVKGPAVDEVKRPVLRPKARPEKHAARPKTKRPKTKRPTPVPRTPKAVTTRPTSELDALIDQATGNHKGPPAKVAHPAPPNQALPSTLTSREVQRGMRLIKGNVRGCFDRFKVPGWARMRVTISSNGRVRTARVQGIFAGTPTGACLQSAVSRARFPRFATPSLSIDYPFHLREG